MLFENKTTGEFGVTLDDLLVKYPNYLIKKNTTKFKDWTSYTLTNKPKVEFGIVTEVKPKAGLQQWSVSYDNVDKLEVYNTICKQIDNACFDAIKEFDKFRNGYYTREAEAKTYIATGYKGLPGQLVRGYANSIGITYQMAANIIISQSVVLRKADMDVEDLRMRKYAIRPESDTIPAMVVKRDQIINEVKQAVKDVS